MDLTHLSLPIREEFLNSRLLREFLHRYPATGDPQIIDFQPWTGSPGSLMVIVGRGFSALRRDNLVLVGDIPCTVVSAEENRLVVITSPDTISGYVSVIMRDAPEMAMRGPRPFYVLDTPPGTDGVDGPPVFRWGIGKGWLSYSRYGGLYMKIPQDELPDNGPTYPVPTKDHLLPYKGHPSRASLVVLPVYPNDGPVPDSAARQSIISNFRNAAKFYDQVSYGAWSFTPTVLNWMLLDKVDSYYRVRSPDDEKVKDSVVYELIWEALSANREILSSAKSTAAGAHMYCIVYFSNGSLLRGANYGPFESLGVVKDRVPVKWEFENAPSMMCVGETADWKLIAHLVGHSVLSPNIKTLVDDEDLYSDDSLNHHDGTAGHFEMMGNYEEGPLFSAYIMAQQGWYSVWKPGVTGEPLELMRTNVKTEHWNLGRSASPISKEFDLVSHGDSPNEKPDRWHILRIRVAEGMDYFIEARCRPHRDSMFDRNLPVSEEHVGGVVVTQVRVGKRPLNNNQQIQTIALMHGKGRNRALIAGEQVKDPVQGMTITVVQMTATSKRISCRVRVQRNSASVASTSGCVYIEPERDDFSNPSIWVNRWLNRGQSDPNPGWPPQKPVDKEEMQLVVSAGESMRHDFVARVRNECLANASHVQVVHYTNSPPGIGDNGSWEAVRSRKVHCQGPTLVGGETYSIVPWVPPIARYSSLKAEISSLSGQATFSTTFSHQNTFTFESVEGQAMEMLVAVRNPQDRRALIRIEVDGVREGFAVYFPHRWVWLEARQEKRYTMLVVPTKDVQDMMPGTRRTKVRVMGFINHDYEDSRKPSWWSAIGGLTMEVRCKRAARIILNDKPFMDITGVLYVCGHIEPRKRDERILVTAEKALGEVISEDTVTGDNGEFEARFWYERLKDRQGMVVAMQAATVDSEDFSSAQSNIVHWHNF